MYGIREDFNKMNQQVKRWRRLGLPLILLFAVLLVSGCSSQAMVLDPKGPIASGQKDLIIISSILTGVILVPVLALTAFIVFRYRDRPNSYASYRPNWSHSTVLETIWWVIPIVIITILAVYTVKGTYALDPSKPIESNREPIVIQATSLDWKWLFQYPEQGIATVNYLYIPEDVPIRFELTSDAPMNSLWIPQLGGQMYTMSGHATALYLQADELGTYYGSGAGFSGEHFADMNFDVHAVSEKEFEAWANEVKQTSSPLTEEGYEKLALPGIAGEQSYSEIPKGLFQSIVTKYSADGAPTHGSHGTEITETSGTEHHSGQ
jgi:cytochrome o ubiquinol oxidase subunit 2